MAKLPLISGRKLIKILQKLGFQKIRQEGSHIFLRHKDERTTIVPMHPGEKISKDLLNKIIKKDIRLTKKSL